MTTFPAAALIADTTIAEAVVDASVEANLRSPISVMENECIASPTPVAGGPEKPTWGASTQVPGTQ